MTWSLFNMKNFFEFTKMSLSLKKFVLYVQNTFCLLKINAPSYLGNSPSSEKNKTVEVLFNSVGTFLFGV